MVAVVIGIPVRGRAFQVPFWFRLLEMTGLNEGNGEWGHEVVDPTSVFV